MSLEDLSLFEILNLCRRAGGACLQRLRDISANVDPFDRPLRTFLERLQEDALRNVERTAEFAARMGPTDEPARGEPLYQQHLNRHFQSFGTGFGEGWLDRDAAMHFAECVEEESSRFYWKLSHLAPDDESARFFATAAEGDASRLARLRAVLL